LHVGVRAFRSGARFFGMWIGLLVSHGRSNTQAGPRPICADPRCLTSRRECIHAEQRAEFADDGHRVARSHHRTPSSSPTLCGSRRRRTSDRHRCRRASSPSERHASMKSTANRGNDDTFTSPRLGYKDAPSVAEELL
jgi:hypothetical protein